MPKLDFINGQFVFDGSIVSFQAAVEQRFYATEKAEKVFLRAFNQVYNVPPLPQLSFLDPHQIEGVKFILSRKRSYLAQAPGAGKTGQAIVAAFISELPTVFIVPPSLLENWKREIKKFYKLFYQYDDFAREIKVSFVTSTEDRFKVEWDANILIVPDSMLSKPWVYERLEKMKNHFIAVDEASRFKESTSERSRIFYGGIVKNRKHHGLFQSAKHTVFLDGSPMPNRPMELWAPLYALDPLAIDCQEQRDFGFKYCGAQINDRGEYLFTGSSNEDELQAKITRKFMHVVPEEVLNHPERLRSILYMDKDVRSVEHKKWEAVNLTKGVVPVEADSHGELARFRRELGTRKINWVAEYVRERLERNKKESILVFAWHRDVCHGLAEVLSQYSPQLIIGGTSASARETYIKEFNAGKFRLFILNIQAGGRGHNLPRADRVIFAEFSWTDELNKQCEKRASRKGRDATLPVRCEYIAVPNSLDERVLRSNFTKEKRVKRVIR